MNKQNKKGYSEELERMIVKKSKKREGRRKKKMKVDSAGVKNLEKIIKG